ncbi:acyl-CoA thioesterase [Bacillus luteolus]|uniref:Acyl-CoA thioesterase n=1 Tax=Litchfieldia luteola TaxID=682179 RepID=A0ABR9QJI7_9BACI|nr:thioesterase family protein [Cytobacillus luteolus]MBE4908619.1 acyl-CoA thioesterase [Cytobacillus luteolus]MBP1941475.1 acyl-CoA thioester hydrolase [Cytobacillus luteolus]
MFKKVIDPRVSETDGAGHINNTTIPVWFESGRDQIFRVFTPSLSFQEWKCVIVKMNVEYVGQIYYGSPVTVMTWISRIGNSSFEVYEEIHQDQKLCAKGNATYVNFNFVTQKSEPIPDEIRNELKPHLLVIKD